MDPATGDLRSGTGGMDVTIADGTPATTCVGASQMTAATGPLSWPTENGPPVHSCPGEGMR